MVYHYSKKKYSTSYNDLNLLHETVIKDLESVTKQIQSRIPNIKVCWTKKNGLGCVFTDLDETKLGAKPPKNGLYFNGNLIGKGETALFDEIQNRYEYLLLTSTLTKRTSDEFTLNNGEKVVVVNVDQFKEIMDTKSNLQSVVKVLLRSNPPEDILMLLEKLLRQVQDEDVKTIMEKLERLFYRFKIEENKDVQLIIRIITHLIDNLQVENPEILKKIPELSNIGELIVSMRSDYFNSILGQFQDRLKEFETIIDSAPKEQALQDFIKVNPWILDFKFFQYPEPEVQKEMEIKDGKKGRADLIFSKKQFNTENITIVEFKKVDVNTTGFTRSDQNLSTIMSPVVKGLSQLIHYIENTKNAYVKVDGILVIGKRNEESDYFIDTFQQYLQKIEIVTYDRLLEKTSEIVKGLEAKKPSSTKNAITSSQDQTLL